MTKKTILGVIFLAGILFITGQAMAMVDSLKGKGSIGGNLALSDWTVETETSAGSSSEEDYQQLTIDFTFNFFLTHSIEIGVRDMLSKNMVGDNDSGSNYLLLRGAFNLYSSGSTFVPYLGPQAGYYQILGDRDSDREDAAAAFGGFIGFKNFISDNASVNVELDYLVSKIDDEGYSTTISGTKALIGFSYYFGGY